MVTFPLRRHAAVRPLPGMPNGVCLHMRSCPIRALPLLIVARPTVLVPCLKRLLFPVRDYWSVRLHPYKRLASQLCGEPSSSRPSPNFGPLMNSHRVLNRPQSGSNTSAHSDPRPVPGSLCALEHCSVLHLESARALRPERRDGRSLRRTRSVGTAQWSRNPTRVADPRKGPRGGRETRRDASEKSPGPASSITMSILAARSTTMHIQAALSTSPLCTYKSQVRLSPLRFESHLTCKPIFRHVAQERRPRKHQFLRRDAVESTPT